MNRWKRIPALLAALVLMTGCGRQTADLTPQQAVETLAEQLTFTDQMNGLDHAGTCRFYDIDPSLTEDSAAYVGSGATAESAAVFQAVDAAAAEQIAAALESFTENWADGYADYKPEEVPKLTSAVLEREGVFVVFCVTADHVGAKTAVQALLHP